MSDSIQKSVRSLVAATDLSEGANHAVEQAARLAKRQGARLWLLHVFNDGAWATLGSLLYSEHWAQREPVLAARDRLSQLVGEIAGRHGIDVRAETRTGRAAAEIAAFAADCGAELLVVGERGEGGFGNAMIGGTALKLLEQASLPVLLVRRPPSGFESLIVAVDFSENSLRAALGASALFPEARHSLVHAFSVPFEGRMRLAGATDLDIERYRLDERHRAEEKMAAFVEGLGPGRRSAVIAQGYPPVVLFDEANERAADLIVVGRHGGGRIEERLLGSVTQNVLYQAPCDVLLVP